MIKPEFSSYGSRKSMSSEKRIVWEKWIHPEDEDNLNIKSDGWDDEEDLS